MNIRITTHRVHTVFVNDKQEMLIDIFDIDLVEALSGRIASSFRTEEPCHTITSIEIMPNLSGIIRSQSLCGVQIVGWSHRIGANVKKTIIREFKKYYELGLLDKLTIYCNKDEKHELNRLLKRVLKSPKDLIT
jgi:hypothetical protein